MNLHMSVYVYICRANFEVSSIVLKCFRQAGIFKPPSPPSPPTPFLRQSEALKSPPGLGLNNNIVDIEKLDGICSPTFVVDDFSGLFLNPSIFSTKDLRSA